jgi:hypothetical protein
MIIVPSKSDNFIGQNARELVMPSQLQSLDLYVDTWYHVP